MEARPTPIDHCPLLSQKIEEAKCRLPDDLQKAPWRKTNGGVNVSDDEVFLDCYLLSYGALHATKMFWSLERFPFHKLSPNFEIIDWGCGQGIAPMCFLQRLMRTGTALHPERITLVEPSRTALRRAVENIGALTDKKVPIVARCEYLPSSDDTPNRACTVTDIKTTSLCVVHLLSNVLDLPDVDLVKLARISSRPKAEHFYVCVGPSRYGPNRISSFVQAFRQNKTFQSLSEDANAFLYRSKLFGRCFGGIHAVFSVTTTGTNSPIRPLSFVPRSFSAIFEFDAFKADDRYASFTVATPFDFTVYKAFDATPILAVLTNLVSRGVPTRASPVAERAIRDAYHVTEEAVQYGTISFPAINGTISKGTEKEIRRIGVETAWIEKILLEALLAGRLSLNEDRWRILILGCHPLSGRIAAADLGEQFMHLTMLSRDYDQMRLPRIDVLDQDKHEGQDCHLVMDIDIEQMFFDDGVRFHESFLDRRYKGNAFHIRRNSGPSVRPTFLTTERIVYKPCSKVVPDGNDTPIDGIVAHLTSFLQLIMRKASFRDGQIPILSRALQLQSVIGLLPTGGGKSLTYQLAALLQPGVSMVIDPLNSLVADQMNGLRRNKVDCCSFVSSQQSNEQKRESMEDLVQGRCLFFFASPERLIIQKFRDALMAMESSSVYFAYGVVDEVHCVSEWGHDFRTSYLHLGKNLYQCLHPKVSDRTSDHISLFGLTATASFDVLSDVERELSRDAFPLTPESTVRYESTNRLELQYYVHDCDGENRWRQRWDAEDAKNAALPIILSSLRSKINALQSPEAVDLIKRRFIERENIQHDARAAKMEHRDLNVDVDETWYRHHDSPTAAIVFCPYKTGPIGINDRRKSNYFKPGVVTTLKNELDICSNISIFHGGDGKTRGEQDGLVDSRIDMRDEQDRFINGRTNIMVATKAFGMGIDKPNVRFVVNMSHSGSLESYIQEAGRAGRDGRMALSVIMYNPNQVQNGNEFSTPDAIIHHDFQSSSFRGQNYEKAVLHFFLSKIVFTDDGIADDDPTHDDGCPVPENHRGASPLTTFFDVLSHANPGERIRTTLSWDGTSPFYAALDAYIETHVLSEQELRDKQRYRSNKGPDAKSGEYCALIEKAIYRLCCIGAIDDYTKDWENKTITIDATVKNEGAYYEGLRIFLQRYYSPQRAELEAGKAKAYKGENELQKCLGYLVEFVYDKIAGKRRRAIDDMELFCQLAVHSTKSWIETNEDLKDFVYYYFNSKFARDTFAIDSGEPFSLTTDTQRGKVFDPDLVFKYMRVVDDDVVGSSSQKDNVKHLLGATRLIRRGMTDTNGVIDLLNAYCLLFLGTSNSAVLRDELESSYVSGYKDIRARVDDDETFYGIIDRFEREFEANDRRLMTDRTRRTLHELNVAAELAIHEEWLKDYARTKLL